MRQVSAVRTGEHGQSHERKPVSGKLVVDIVANFLPEHSEQQRQRTKCSLQVHFIP